MNCVVREIHRWCAHDNIELSEWLTMERLNVLMGIVSDRQAEIVMGRPVSARVQPDYPARSTYRPAAIENRAASAGRLSGRAA